MTDLSLPEVAPHVVNPTPASLVSEQGSHDDRYWHEKLAERMPAVDATPVIAQRRRVGFAEEWILSPEATRRWREDGSPLGVAFRGAIIHEAERAVVIELIIYGSDDSALMDFYGLHPAGT
jgi:hypothetical protein